MSIERGAPLYPMVKAAATQVARQPRPELQQVAQMTLQHASPQQVDAMALASMKTASESSTPITRGIGIAIKGAFVAVFSLIASAALWVAGASGAQVAMFFLVLSIVGVALVFWLDATHSPIGGERYKAKTYKQLEMHRIDTDKDIALAKIDAYLETVRIVYGQTDNDA